MQLGEFLYDSQLNCELHQLTIGYDINYILAQ